MLKISVILVIAALSAINGEGITSFGTGGIDAPLATFPAAVLLDTPTQYCGGSIIDYDHVLTAAACVLNESFQVMHYMWFNIIAGDIVFSPASTNRITRRVKNIFVHPYYNPFTGENNLAILRVDESFPTIHNYLQPATFQTAPVALGTNCLLAAFGRQSSTSTTYRTNLVQIQQPTISIAACSSVLTPHANRITNKMMCAASTTANAPCTGNLGSGLYCNGFLTGVLTSGIACGAANTPAVYHQIRAHTAWINVQIQRTDTMEPGCIPFVTEGFPVNIPDGPRCGSYFASY